MLRRKNKGFTLIEIIVVLIILGVLAGISLPAYFSWIERSRSAEAISLLKSLDNQYQICIQTKPWNVCRQDLMTVFPGTEHFTFEGGELGAQHIG